MNHHPTFIEVPKVLQSFATRKRPTAFSDGVTSAQRTLPEFFAVFSKRMRLQDHFLVTAFTIDGHDLQPVGLTLDQIDGDVCVGSQISNDKKGTPLGALSMHRSVIVDWRYADCFDLRGGTLFRSVLENVFDEGARLDYLEDRADFLVGAFNGVPPDVESVFRDVAHGDSIRVSRIFGARQDLGHSRCAAPCMGGSGALVRRDTSLMEWAVQHADEAMCALVAETGAMAMYDRVKSVGHVQAGEHVIESLCFDAARGGNLGTIKWLSTQGFSFNVMSAGGEIPLLLVAGHNKSKELVLELLRHGAHVDARNACGRTALFYAQSPVVAQVLLNHGATRNAIDELGYSAAEYHELSERPDVCEFLRQHGSRYDKRLLTREIRLSDEDAKNEILEFYRTRVPEGQLSSIRENLSLENRYVLPVKSL